MTKQDAIPFVTPFGVARLPRITKPDTEGQYADGKFKTYVEFSKEDHERVVKALRDAAIKFHGETNGADATLPVKELKSKDKKTVEAVVITFKSKYRPAVFDAKKNKLPKDATVGGGSILRIASTIFPWKKTTKIKGEEITEYGVSLRLGDVQVRELKQGGSPGTGEAFDEVEGFEYDGDGDEDNNDDSAFDAL